MKIDANSVVVISGASSGLGAALAILLAERYACRLVVAARRGAHLHEVAEAARQAGATVVEVVADLSTEHGCAKVADAALHAFGHVDVLVNNAGRGNLASVEDTTTADLESMFSINVYALFWLTQRLLSSMKERRQGYVLNVASFAGRIGFPFNAAYVAAKHAVVGFTASLRAELVETGVEAAVVCPAGIVTDWADVTEGGAIGGVFADGIAASRSLARERGLPLAPLTRMKTAADVAERMIAVVEGGRSADVYTHEGTQEQARQALDDRTILEDALLPLYLGMRQVYRNHKK